MEFSFQLQSQLVNSTYGRLQQRICSTEVSSFLPDLMALLAAALFFYFLNLVLVVPWSSGIIIAPIC